MIVQPIISYFVGISTDLGYILLSMDGEEIGAVHPISFEEMLDATEDVDCVIDKRADQEASR